MSITPPTSPAAMALIENMIKQYGYPVLTEDNHDDFVSAQEECVLFFTENPARFPESNDVAMILPELVKEYGERFSAAVIDQSAQRPLQGRYGFNEWPTLVFLRRGQYLGHISRVQDWMDYIVKINQIVTSEPRLAPGIGIPVSQSTSACGG
ncbi:hypothetical protein [Thiolapillus sp.]|uniref:hypothetical protein n=1 Tax=Thiolapillus sp. TaxID=2017437 RepID=UPI003AF6427C